ncbi:hypothetical protein ACH5RR_037081 [Cinchona calisaya]|uniref:Uncharacterized protein n=1 Tax=Cinchona calisaya TaxID=153742 RepID=A0ABD2Y529_9GENT
MTTGVYGSAERRVRMRTRGTSSRKRKSGEGTSGEGSSEQPFEGGEQIEPQFSSDRAQQLFKNNEKHEVIRERNFDLSMHWGLYEDARRAIEEQIRSRHWEGFNTQVDPGATQLVKEFHCNLCELEDGKVRIPGGGGLVDFSADVMNVYFNIPPRTFSSIVGIFEQ